MSRHGPVNSSRAVTRRKEPRRVASNREEYRDVMRRGPSCASVVGRPAGRQWESAENKCASGARCSRRRGYYVASRKSLHASAVKGTGCAGPTRAFSSVGESARLITVRSVVRIHKGPRSYPIGDVAQLEEHLLCKQGVAGSSPAISTGNTPFRSVPPAAVAGFLYVDTRIASLREHWTLPSSRVQVRILETNQQARRIHVSCRGDALTSPGLLQSLNSDDRKGQATKGTRWMPWHQEPMKDVALLR